MSYGDGGLHYNNPVRVLMDESRRIWSPSVRQSGCILSIGTGKPKLEAVGDRGHKILKALAAIVTDTEKIAGEFSNEIDDMDSAERPKYFRFNVDQGLDDVGLEECEKFEEINGATSYYLETHRKDVEECADVLLGLIGMSCAYLT